MRGNGKYQFVRRIKAGGYGEVWVVRDRNGRLLALKRLLDRATSFVEILREEVAKLLRLRDAPGVIRLIDYDLAGPDPFLVMELADGSLGDLIAGPMPAAAALSFVRQLVAVVREAHSRGVVHRDIKPDNVLLREGVVQLADFGLGKNFGSILLTVGGAGTPGYMAPEQRYGPGSVQGDVYGIGATLFHILTGRVPPKDRADLDPRWYVPSCSPAVAECVMRMTRSSWESRPSLDVVDQQLQALLAMERARQASGPRPPGGQVRPTGDLASLAAGIVTAFGIGAGVAALVEALVGGRRRR